MATRPNDADLLYGMKAIGEHIGLTARQAEHLVSHGELPSFRLSTTVCARRSALDAHFAFAEASARQSRKAKDAPAEPARADESPAAPAAVLYGHRAIAAHLGRLVADVAQLDLQRRLPTYLDDGCTVASTAALDAWQRLTGAGA